MGRVVVKLEAGQLVFGRIKFAAQVGISEAKVRAALDVMKSLNMITIKSMAKFSIISITNWQKYQDDNQQITAEQPASNQQATSNEPASDHIQESKELKESKEVKNLKDITPQAASPATPEKKSRKTGSRLPEDWRPTQEYVDAAMQLNPDYTREWFSATAHKFRDYWVAKTGKDATKADWLATWRNWVRNDLEYNRGKNNAKPKQLDNESTDWVGLVIGSTPSGNSGEQDLQWLEGDFSSVGGGDQGSGLPEPSQGGMAKGAD